MEFLTENFEGNTEHTPKSPLKRGLLARIVGLVSAFKFKLHLLLKFLKTQLRFRDIIPSSEETEGCVGNGAKAIPSN